MSTAPELPADLRQPENDGACAHLPGTKAPDIALGSTEGIKVNLSELAGRTIVYCYPRMGKPGQMIPESWNAIPGARGCTNQSCSFRDHFSELVAAGAEHLFGLSTQDVNDLREAADRLHLPFSLLSDEELKFANALNLPRFQYNGLTLIKRLTLVIDDGMVTHVLYPVFPPDRSAEQTLEWLRLNSASSPVA
jgi:peroxiredoxin